MVEDLTSALAAEVRRLLDERRWSGRELARRTSLPTNTIAAKLRGERGIDLADVEQIAEAFGVTAAYLVARAEAARAHPSG